jgi:hypothetical protein
MYQSDIFVYSQFIETGVHDMKLKWDFIFDGVKGLAERYKSDNYAVYIFWNGMGFHLTAATDDLKSAVLNQEPKL